jgi:hypothetical protein
MKIKMRTAIVISMVYTLCTLSPALGQTPDKYVQIGDTTINLADVDLEKGMVVNKEKYSMDRGIYGEDNVNVKLKLFTSSNYKNYTIVHDTLFSVGFDGYQCSRIQYYSNNSLLFDKYLNGFGVDLCYISSNGDIVITDLSCNDAGEFVHIYNLNGELIKKYNNQHGRFYIGRLHNYFFICNHSKYKGANTYDLIDKSGNIVEVVFPQGFLKGIEFSPNENYYLVRLNKDKLLYDINNNLIWKLENHSSINFWLDEKSYLTHNYQNNSIELKDLFNHKLIYSIDHVTFKDELLPIYRWNIIDSCFYAIGKRDSIYVYNFYNANGLIIQTETVPVIKRTKPYTVTKKSGEFMIEPRKLNQ